MNRLSITRKATVFMLKHPRALRTYLRVTGKHKSPSLPRGYRKVTKQ